MKSHSTTNVSSHVGEVGVGAKHTTPTFDELRALYRNTGFCKHDERFFRTAITSGRKITDCGVCGKRISYEVVPC